jgi:histone demethylase JARID1
MVDREIEGRHNMRSYNVREVLEEQDRGEDQYSCKVCKTFCYLSQVTCQCTRDNFCFEHFEQCCECPMEQRTLCTRFSDDALIAILRDVEQRSVAPTTWRNKMVKLLSLSARPSLDDMITLVEEGDRIDHPIPELSMLRKCVTRGRKWMEAAGIFLEDRKPSSASRYRPHDRSISHITTLLEDVVNLGFSSPVIDALDDIRNRALRCQVKAKDLIAKVEADGRDVHLPSCEAFLHEIAAIPVWIEEFGEIQKVVGGQQLVQELRRVLEQPGALDLEQVQDFIQRAEAHNFSEDDEQLVILKARERKGRAWVNQANALLGGRKHKSQLISLIQVDNRETPVDFRVMDHLKAALARFEEWDHQAMIWGNEQHREHRPTLDDVARLLKRSRDEFEHSPIMKNLSQQHGFAIDLEDRCEEVLSNQYQHKEERCVFEMLDTWRDYAHKHLDMFILPKFDKLESHIKLHRRWVEGLPWYSHNDGKIEGQKVLEDAIEATRPNDDVPPADPTFSCICPHPVMPPAPGEPTNAVQCDNCAARFHGPCMHRARSCPFCDQKHWDGSEKSARPWHFAYLQTVLFSAPEISRNYSKEWKHLEIIVHRVDRLANNVGQFLVYLKHPQNQRSEYLAQARHFLRKLHRLQFVVAPSVDQSYGLELSGLHRVLATLPSTATRSMTKKRKRPKFHFGQDSERDWDDGTRCICRGRTAYLLNYPTVECEICSRLYHESCVFFPPKSDQTQGKGSFICPLCCVRKGRPYANAEVRVKDPSTSRVL